MVYKTILISLRPAWMKQIPKKGCTPLKFCNTYSWNSRDSLIHHKHASRKGLYSWFCLGWMSDNTECRKTEGQISKTLLYILLSCWDYSNVKSLLKISPPSRNPAVTTPLMHRCEGQDCSQYPSCLPAVLNTQCVGECPEGQYCQYGSCSPLPSCTPLTCNFPGDECYLQPVSTP